MRNQIIILLGKIRSLYSTAILSKSFLLTKSKHTSSSYFKDPTTGEEYARTYAQCKYSNKKCQISGIVLILEYASIFLIVIKIYIKIIANLMIVLYPDQAKTK